MEEKYREAARVQWSADDLDIEDAASVSISEDSTGEIGAWVAAWVFVGRPEREEETP